MSGSPKWPLRLLVGRGGTNIRFGAVERIFGIFGGFSSEYSNIFIRGEQCDQADLASRFILFRDGLYQMLNFASCGGIHGTVNKDWETVILIA